MVTPQHPLLAIYKPKDLRHDEFWDRKLYIVRPEVVDDLQRIRALGPGALSDISPNEQTMALFRSFSVGEQLIPTKMFKKVRRRPQHVVELRTADVRVFGWCFAKDVFVACRVEVLENLKEDPDDPTWVDPYPPYFAQVVAKRKEMNLECVDSEDLNDHFTNL